MARLRPKQITPGTDGQVIKTVSGVSQYANHSPTTDDKAQTPIPTSGNNSGAGITIAETPSGDGHVMVMVNGVQQELGDGVLTKDCYFVDQLFVEIDAGDVASSARKADGSVWTWGFNSEGQLGINVAGNRSSPVSVVGNHIFKQLATGVGSGQSAVLKIDGTCWTWGSGVNGELGQGSSAVNRSSPVSVVGTHSFIQVTTGTSFSGGIKQDGSAWMWGTNSAGGTLGDNTVVNKSSPVSVVGTHSFIAISAGGLYTLALKNDGSCWAWGSSGDGKIGDNTTTNRSSPVSVVGTHSFISIAAGGNSLGLKSDGTVWVWGENTTGGIGDDTTTNRSSPVSVVGTHSFVAISSGNHSVALKADGSIWAWGFNDVGRLGDDSTVNRSSPVSVVGTHSFIMISAGTDQTLALKAHDSMGSIWAWGDGAFGQLGTNNTTDRSSPVSVLNTGSNLRAIADIQAGDSFIWNGDLAGFELETDDEIDFNYVD